MADAVTQKTFTLVSRPQRLRFHFLQPVSRSVQRHSSPLFLAILT